MLTLTLMIRNGVPDAPPATPAAPLRCQGCRHLVTSHFPAGTAGPAGTSARCMGGEGGQRLIGWHWQAGDRAPHWCPLRERAA